MTLYCEIVQHSSLSQVVQGQKAIMPTQPTDIQNIINAIQQTKLELNRKLELETLREELETALATVELRRKKQRDEDTELETERQLLRRRLGDVDHQLDDLDEDLELRVLNLRADLVRALLEHFPDEQPRQQERAQQLSEGRRAQQDLETLEGAGREVLTELEMALAVWEKRGQRGLLNRLFGTNPAITASKHLEKAMDHAQAALLVLSEMLSQTNPHPTVQHAHPVIEQFIFVATELQETAWSFGQFSQTLAPHREHLREIMSRIDLQSKETRRLIAELEAEVDSWAETFAQRVK